MTGNIVWPKDKLPETELIKSAVLNGLGASREDLYYHGRHAGVAKAVAVELCCRLSGKSQMAAGQHFGYGSDAGAGKQRQRLAAKLADDRKISSRVEKMANAIVKSIV